MTKHDSLYQEYLGTVEHNKGFSFEQWLGESLLKLRSQIKEQAASTNKRVAVRNAQLKPLTTKQFLKKLDKFEKKSSKSHIIIGG